MDSKSKLEELYSEVYAESLSFKSTMSLPGKDSPLAGSARRNADVVQPSVQGAGKNVDVVQPSLQEAGWNTDVVPHPLQRGWTYFYMKKDTRRKWEENQHPIASFETVEDFWALYNYVMPVHDLPIGTDFSVFKNGVQPKWEDDWNRFGGRWLINLDHKHSSLEGYWREMLICMIGEVFGMYSSEVCGAVVSVRARGDKVAVWMKTCLNTTAITAVGDILKAKLQIDDSVIKFQPHVENIKTMYGL